MFNTASTSPYPQEFLRPRETVHLPFKFQTFRADQSVPEQVCTCLMYLFLLNRFPCILAVNYIVSSVSGQNEANPLLRLVTRATQVVFLQQKGKKVPVANWTYFITLTLPFVKL